MDQGPGLARGGVLDIDQHDGRGRPIIAEDRDLGAVGVHDHRGAGEGLAELLMRAGRHRLPAGIEVDGSIRFLGGGPADGHAAAQQGQEPRGRSQDRQSRNRHPAQHRRALMPPQAAPPAHAIGALARNLSTTQKITGLRAMESSAAATISPSPSGGSRPRLSPSTARMKENSPTCARLAEMVSAVRRPWPKARTVRKATTDLPRRTMTRTSTTW